MRTTVAKLPEGAKFLDSETDDVPYEWYYNVELYSHGDDYYVVYETQTGTCEVCGGSNEDIDKFDNEKEARAWYDECVSREFY